MQESAITKGLIRQFHLELYRSIVIDEKEYKETINFNTQIALEVLKLTEWTEDQIKEQQAVLFNHRTERYNGYTYYWHKSFYACLDELLRDSNTRRAIVYFGSNYNSTPTCLTSIQFLIRDRKLHVVVNFRSWELSTFAAYDLCLISGFVSRMVKSYGEDKLSLGILHINASSAHILIPS
jgi:thymidylate synthase